MEKIKIKHNNLYNMRKAISSILLSLGLINFCYSLENLGIYGKVYQIEEVDIIEYIKKMVNYSPINSLKPLKQAFSKNCLSQSALLLQ